MGPVSGIGNLNESPLHLELKRRCAPPGSRFEVTVDGYVVDAVGDGEIVEIQTANLGAARAKLEHLARHHRVRLVLPVARELWLLTRHPDGRCSRRRSPRHAPDAQPAAEVFRELVAAPTLLALPGLQLEVAVTEQEALRLPAPRRRGRARWRVAERRLLKLLERRRFEHPAQLGDLLPPPSVLPEPFTTAELAAASGLRRELCQKMAYCLHHSRVLLREGKRGNAHLYRRAPGPPAPLR